MPATGHLSTLAERKRLLVLQSDLQRQILVIERDRVQARWMQWRQRFSLYRWWWMAGAGLVGLVVARRAGTLGRWWPVAAKAMRFLRALR